MFRLMLQIRPTSSMTNSPACFHHIPGFWTTNSWGVASMVHELSEFEELYCHMDEALDGNAGQRQKEGVGFDGDGHFVQKVVAVGLCHTMRLSRLH